MTRDSDGGDLGDVTRQLIELARSGKGLTPDQMLERAERALDERIDEFEQEARTTIAAMSSGSKDEVLEAAEALRAASLLYRYDLLGVLAGSLVVWCSEHADDPRLARAVIAHSEAMTTVLQMRMRGERPAERAALLAGLEATLRDG